MINNPLAVLLEKNALTDPNFIDWLQNLRIVLSMESLGYVFEAYIPADPIRTRDNEEAKVHEKCIKDDIRAHSFIMGSMINELYKAHEKMTTSRQIVAHLTELYAEHSTTA